MAAHGCTPICKSRGCWAECFICGDEYPLDSMTLHYKKERYVCCKCDDCPSWSDYMEDFEVPTEERCDTGGQGVTGQGGQTGLPTIVPPPETPGGGGSNPPEPPPSDECDEQWDYNGRSLYYGGTLIGSNTGYTFSGNLKTQGAPAFSGTGVLLDINNTKTHISAAITLTGAGLRVTEINGTPTCDMYLEAILDNLPTGFRIGPVRNAGDISTIVGTLPITAGQMLEWFAYFYDTSGNVINTPIGAVPSVNFEKRFKVVLEYTNDAGVHPMLMDPHHTRGTSPEGDRVYVYQPLDSMFIRGTPNEPDLTLQDQLTPGIGFFTPTELSAATATQHYGRNFVESEVYYQLMNGTQISDIINFHGDFAFIDPIPTPHNVERFDMNVDHDLDTLSLANIDTTGRFQLINHIGPPESFLAGTSIEQDFAIAYRFPEHPRSQALVAGVYRGTALAGLGNVRRAGLNEFHSFTGAVTNQSQARAATLLYSKSKFHHFSFWSMYEPVQAIVRCQLMIDGTPLFEMFLLDGERLTQYADMFVCVDGQLAWWEFTNMGGGSTRMNLVVTCLYGPEGE